MCVAVCGSALMGLPYATSLLGWPAGIVLLATTFMSTLWASCLLARLCRWDGRQHMRYRDLAEVKRNVGCLVHKLFRKGRLKFSLETSHSRVT